MFKLFSVLLVLVVLLTSCAPGPHAVKEGHGWGYIANVELRTDGTYLIWMFGDNGYAYCTDDAQVVENAQTYGRDHTYVEIEYTTINGSGWKLVQSGCTRLNGGKTDSDAFITEGLTKLSAVAK